ncbi:MAG: poly(R)-hydroxyalkanoic acid synthase subunit PhaE [Gammaproteobacteria bacterium]|nr:poly(R)-hydroxyalkanoic acid synthase subunit PhaE [Gammaproteobacteria bacterium]
MSDQDQQNPDYLGQLFELQQQYLNNLGQLLGQPQSTRAAPNPFDNWWEQMAKPQGGEFNDLFKQLSRLGMAGMQNPFAQMQQQAAETQDLMAWFNQMNQQFNQWLKLAGQGNPVIEMMNQQFRQQMQAPFAPGMFPWLQQPSPQPAFSNINAEFMQLLQNLFSDEEKHNGEQLLTNLQQYQQTLMEMNYLLAQVGIDSLTELQQKLADNEQASLQQMYQWWMEISQQVFQQHQISARYRELQNNLQSLQQDLTRDFENYRLGLIRNLGLVSREEYDGLQSQVQELAKEINRLKAEKSSPGQTQGGAASAEDDFTQLNGIGAKFNQKLHEQGIHNLQQLASLSDEMLKHLDQNLQSKGKIIQDQWREQAEQILNKMSGKR